MKKILIGIVILVVVALGVWKYQTYLAQPTSDKPVVKIGVILPITGNLSEVGEISKEIITKIKDETKKSPIDFEFIVEDNGLDVKKTIMIANKMISYDKVSAIISAFSGPATAVTPIATQNNIFHICVANDCNVALGPLNFANWQSVDIASDKLIELLKQDNTKKVVIFTLENTGNALISNKIKEKFKKNNIIFEEFRFNPTERDFASIIAKANKINNVDYWILNTLSPGLELIRKQMVLQNINIPVTGIQTFGDAQDKTLLKGFKYVEAAPVNKDVKEYLYKKLQTQNVTVAAYVYDSLNMIVKIVEDFYDKNKAIPTSAEMAKALLDMQHYNGAVGNIKITPDRIMQSESIITELD